MKCASRPGSGSSAPLATSGMVPEVCVWASVSPGMRTRWPTSSGRAPSGHGSAASVTRRMIPSSTRTAAFSRSGAPVPSNSRAPVSQSRPRPTGGAAISAGNLCATCLPVPFCLYCSACAALPVLPCLYCLCLYGPAAGPSGSYIVPAGIHRIKHVIIVMQENRSFRHLFRDLSRRAGRDPHEELARRPCAYPIRGRGPGGAGAAPGRTIDTVPAYFRGKPPCVGCTTPPPGV